MFEKAKLKMPSVREVVADGNLNVLSNAITAFLFTLTGPIAILLNAAQIGGLAEREIVSWFFAGYGLGGLFTVVLSFMYRQPISIAWSLPAAAIIGFSLQHLTFPEVIGACVVTGVMIILVSVTGVAKKVMDFIPLPIVMGMVAGVFLPFVSRLVSIFTVDPLLSAITIGTFFILSSGKLKLKLMPPVLFSVVIGIILVAVRREFNLVPFEFSIIQPVLYVPEFSLKALLELVLPLFISVIGIHNTQGIAILRGEGYNPPVNVMTFTCGIGSIAMGLLGSVPTCVTGPVNAILNTSGSHKSRYVGSILLGILLLIAAFFAPVTIRIALMIPATLIGLLGGLALFRILLDSFRSAFKSKYLFGAMSSFIVTASNITFLNVGSAFWGLVVGCALSLLMEHDDFRKQNERLS